MKLKEEDKTKMVNYLMKVLIACAIPAGKKLYDNMKVKEITKKSIEDLKITKEWN